MKLHPNFENFVNGQQWFVKLVMSAMIGRSTKEVQGIAEKDNLVCMFAQPKELLCDFDEPYDTAVIRVQANLSSGLLPKILKQNGFEFLSTFYTTSKSGNCHLYVQTNFFVSPPERCLLQAILGSDLTRETFNFIRHKFGEMEQAVVLFETPEEAAKVRRWRTQWKFKAQRDKLAAMREGARKQQRIQFHNEAMDEATAYLRSGI